MGKSCRILVDFILKSWTLDLDIFYPHIYGVICVLNRHLWSAKTFLLLSGLSPYVLHSALLVLPPTVKALSVNFYNGELRRTKLKSPTF